MVIQVRVKPGSKSGNRVVKTDFGYDVFVSAVAENGKANTAVVEALAKELGVDKVRIEIVAGKSSKMKLVRIGGPEGT